MNSKAIGVFDSGVGGLTCVKELMHILPNENIVYLGDTARIPYGTRSRQTIVKYARQCVNFLNSMDVKLVIAACGTVSTVASKEAAEISNVPFMDVLSAAVNTAAAQSVSKRVGVIGTNATIKSGAYGRELKNRDSNISVYNQACPMFVYLVENRYYGREKMVAKLITDDYLSYFDDKNIDTLILGCTHYPLLADVIGDRVGKDIRLIDPGKEVALAAKGFLESHNMLNQGNDEGTKKFYVTDTPDSFSQNVEIFLPSSFSYKVKQVDIDIQPI